MAPSARASRALLFMKHCRCSHPVHPRRLSSIRHSSSSASPSPSPYAPTNFSQRSSPLKSPTSSALGDPSPAVHTPSLPSPRPDYAHPVARTPPTEIRGTRLTFYSWLKSLLGFPPTASTKYKAAPIQIQNNPYRARTRWPPDFRSVDPKQQFHFEKTYRRRAALKWARPGWNKSIRILQQTLIVATICYFVFILEPEHGEGTPFDGFRVWFFEKMGQLGQLPDETREEADRLSEEAKRRMKPADKTVEKA